MKRQYFKYNQDDILEILTEHLAETNGFDTFSSRATLIVDDDDNVRLVAAIGELDDEKIRNINLNELDETLEYNGTHPERLAFLSPQALKEVLDKITETGDF